MAGWIHQIFWDFVALPNISFLYCVLLLALDFPTMPFWDNSFTLLTNHLQHLSAAQSQVDEMY